MDHDRPSSSDDDKPSVKFNKSTTQARPSLGKAISTKKDGLVTPTYTSESSNGNGDSAESTGDTISSGGNSGFGESNSNSSSERGSANSYSEGSSSPSEQDDCDTNDGAIDAATVSVDKDSISATAVEAAHADSSNTCTSPVGKDRAMHGFSTESTGGDPGFTVTRRPSHSHKKDKKQETRHSAAEPSTHDDPSEHSRVKSSSGAKQEAGENLQSNGSMIPLNREAQSKDVAVPAPAHLPDENGKINYNRPKLPPIAALQLPGFPLHPDGSGPSVPMNALPKVVPQSALSGAHLHTHPIAAVRRPHFASHGNYANTNFHGHHHTSHHGVHKAALNLSMSPAPHNEGLMGGSRPSGGILASPARAEGPSAERPFTCPHEGCDWTFARASDQRRHIRSHEKPLLQCPYWHMDTSCHRNGGAFNRLDVLKRHLRLVHYARPDSNLDSGSCKTCNQDFPNTRTFLDHAEQCARDRAVFLKAGGVSGASSSNDSPSVPSGSPCNSYSSSTGSSMSSSSNVSNSSRTSNSSNGSNTSNSPSSNTSNSPTFNSSTSDYASSANSNPPTRKMDLNGQSTHVSSTSHTQAAALSNAPSAPP